MSNIIDALTDKVRGRVITASDQDYDDARAVYNAMHDRKPSAVIQCVDSADVMAAIAAARENGVDLAIRGGGATASPALARWTTGSSSTSRG